MYLLIQVCTAALLITRHIYIPQLWNVNLNIVPIPFVNKSN